MLIRVIRGLRLHELWLRGTEEQTAVFTAPTYGRDGNFRKPFWRAGVAFGMDAHFLSPHVLDEDLQIVRATLASISDEVNRLSPQAGQAVNDALLKIDEAHAEFVRSSLED